MTSLESKYALATAIMLGAVFPAQSALAQASAAPSADTGSDIVVTGTRLRSAAAAPTPVLATSAEQLQSASPKLITDALNQLPAFRNSSTGTSNTVSPARDGGSSFLNLRGLGKERTLILLDGRRFVASNISGVPDVNLIPQDLVQRVEVVTGGASATYGSDAVAGVVNFILDKKFIGVRASGQTGVSSYRDGGLRKLTLTAGSRLGGNGNIVGSVEYFKQDKIGFGAGRRILEERWGIAPTGLASPRLTVAGPIGIYASAGGSIVTGPLAGNQFLPGGAIAPYSFGTNRTATSQIGGDGVNLDSAIAYGVERKTGFLRPQFELGDVTVYAEGLIAESKSTVDLANSFNGLTPTAFTIFRDNAFLSPTAQALMDNAGVTSFPMTRVSAELPQTLSTKSTTYRLITGADWNVSDRWKVSGYYMHGENDYFSDTHTTLRRNLFAAVDAVVNPANGQIVCRSTLAGRDPGCVPLNLFGVGSPSQAAVQYVQGEAISTMKLKEDIASLSVAGSLFTLPAGEVKVAVGGEYRREQGRVTKDPFQDATMDGTGLRGVPPSLIAPGVTSYYLFNSFPGLAGKYSVREGFGEIEVPLLKDAAFARSLSINGAIRLVDYSTVGSVTTWKVGGSWEPFYDLRFRATRSRDIRAANLGELFTPSFESIASVIYQGVSQPARLFRSGNPNLAPEKADTLTIGAVYRPSWLPRFTATVDYYDIKIRDGITQPATQDLINACAAGSATACSSVLPQPNGAPIIITASFLNLASARARGVDAEFNYRGEVGKGTLSVRALISYLDENSTQIPGAAKIDRAGDVGVGGLPHWSGNLQLGYELGAFSVFAQERYIGGGKLDTTLERALDNNRVSAVFYTDVTAKLRIYSGSNSFEIFGTVNNLFNRKPPVAPSAPFGIYYSTNKALYDVIGRYMSVGVRVKV